MAGLSAVIAFSSCKKDEDDEMQMASNGTLNLNIAGLEDLGAGFKYEGWLIVAGAPVTTGTFTVNAAGVMSQNQFSVAESSLDAASTFVLTIEPSPDADPAPTATHVLAGDFNANSADLSISHPAALGDDFLGASGGYILATPTDGGAMNNENSGVWFMDPMAGPGASLDLPVLPEGWAYEGWVVLNGSPLSTGTFTNVAATDAAAVYSGTMAGPPFPGEDFLLNAPSGLTFPIDLSGRTVVISIEPSPDNSAAPFVLKPLLGDVPSPANVHQVYSLGNTGEATHPSGTAGR